MLAVVDTMPTLRLHLVFLTLLAALTLDGCSLRRPPALALRLDVAPNANDNSVVPFDIVVVRDKKDLKQISQMDAAAWFGPKGRCNFRGGDKAKVVFHSWEFVPGQAFRIDISTKGGAKAVFGFADYLTPGVHRVDLKTNGSQMVQIGGDGVRALSTTSFANPGKASAPEKQRVCPDD